MVRWLVDHATTIILAVLVIFVAGVYSYVTLPREASPDITIPVVIVISIICFGIIQLPPGDYADAYAALATTTGGGTVSKEYIPLST